MLKHLLDRDARFDIANEHGADQVDAVFAHDVRDAEVAVHDLVNAIEWILFVNDGVQEDTQGPDILLFATVGLAG